MQAYHNKEELKATVLAEMAGHRAADNLVKGQYWQGGKGCAVGCLLKSSNHIEYEERFGIPVALARLEDTIFEGLPNDMAMLWPERFLGAFNTGADTRCVHWHFLHWLLTEELNVSGDGPVFDQVRAAIKQCADVLVPLKSGQPVDKSAASAARSAAWSAASAARSAARSAESAAWSAARSAAWSAESAARSAERSTAWSAASAARSAESAAWSAESAARSAESAARSAESTAWSAESAAWSAESTARSAESTARSAESAAYERMADKLIELIKAQGV